MDGMAAKSAEDVEIAGRVARHLRLQMETRGLSMRQTATRLGVSSSNLQRMLAGTRGMSAGFLLKVHRIFNIPGDVLLDEPPRLTPAAHGSSGIRKH